MNNLDSINLIDDKKPKTKRSREEQVDYLYNIHYNNIKNNFDIKDEDARMLARNNTIRSIFEVGWDGLDTAIKYHNYGGHSDNEKIRKYNSDEDYFKKDNAILKAYYPNTLTAKTDTAYVDALLHGNEGRIYNSVNPNYKSEFLNMKTARKLANMSMNNRRAKDYFELKTPHLNKFVEPLNISAPKPPYKILYY